MDHEDLTPPGLHQCKAQRSLLMAAPSHDNAAAPIHGRVRHKDRPENSSSCVSPAWARGCRCTSTLHKHTRGKLRCGGCSSDMKLLQQQLRLTCVGPWLSAYCRSACCRCSSSSACNGGKKKHQIWTETGPAQTVSDRRHLRLHLLLLLLLRVHIPQPGAAAGEGER